MSYTTNPLIINKLNWVDGSTYKYSFGNVVNLTDKSIAVEKIAINFTWPNITAAKQNNTFSIIHPTLAGTTTLNITIPDGGYNISDLNNYLRWYLVNNGYYIENTSSLEQTVYCEFIINTATYQIDFVSYPLPTALPTGYTAGSAITFPATAKGPQLIVNANGFRDIIGFAAGTFPAVQPTVLTTVGSTVTPIVSDTNTVLLTVDSCFNKFSSFNSTVIYAFSPAGYQFGSLISSEAKTLSFVPQQGSRSDITIRLTDQYMRPLEIKDNDVTIVLQLRSEI